MARSSTLLLLALATSCSSLTTCPGFPGFCSESFPGQTCQVVCEAGRNNVPLCQDDGTWTDIPRCVEHEPGVQEQIPGLCPGISGYCSTNFLHGSCRFDCPLGPDINSVCTDDGTWQPYPTCRGDLRDLRDGCDGCPGPRGGPRNRTAEAILSPNTVSDRRVPKIVTGSGGRKSVPSFAGNINIGPLREDSKPEGQQQFPRQQNRQQQQQFPQQNRQQQQFPQQNRQQQQLPQQNRQQENPRQQQFPQQNRQQQQQVPQQNRQQQQPSRSPLFAEQFPAEQEPPRQPLEEQPRRPQDSNLSLFDRIKARAQADSASSPPSGSPQPIPPRPQQAAPQPRQQPRRPQQSFGVFESVDLGGLGGPSPPASPRQQGPRPRQQTGDFFGEFQNVALQG